ncbi:delta-60 repeat domain-containing protein [Candidatus Electronema sp. JM]|uniref:delta-60 repeat domain-containing protein n=1 Tax=Candidatus Electronema sp. JM TaxID=3401571 RepID=UPI003AA9DBE2
MTARLLVLGTLILSAAAPVSAAVLDSSFGHDGRVAVELGTGGSRANAVLAQPDGKILVAGSSSNGADRDFMLFRLLPDGSLDQEFNQTGTVITPLSSFDDEALSVALQPDGKILAAGYSSSDKDRDFALVRYNSDGSLDQSFGKNGVAVSPVGSSHDEITDVAAQADGGIIITGSAQGSSGRAVVLGRYLPNGTLDATFAEKGFALSMVGVDAQAESVALGNNGQLLVSGTYSDGQRRSLMVLSFASSGHLNQNFGEKGVAVPADSSTFSEGYGMVLNDKGGIVVAGSVGKEGARDAALFGFTAEGRPDSSFEQNGVLVSSAGEGDDALLDVTAAGETLSAAGFKTTGEQREFLLVTYHKGTAQENIGGSSLAMQTGGQLQADALSTGFSSGKDTSTAIAALSATSLVAVGESAAEQAQSSAAVSKYALNTVGSGATNLNLNSASSTNTNTLLDQGNQYLVTEEPYEVTRTTAIVPAKVLESLGNVTARGIVFGTMPNPMLTNSASANTGAPAVTNNSASSTSSNSSTASANLSLTTDINATCKYGTTAGVSYENIENTFSTTGTTIHSQIVTGLTNGYRTYYARCKNISSGVTNTTDTEISFTVTTGTAYTAPEHSQQLIAVSGKIMSGALQNVGSLFVSTAFAQTTGVTATTGSTNNTTATNFLEKGSTSEGSGSGAFSSKLTNLKPGTFFYARAYATVGGVTYYGNQVGFRTADSCFIATAAYGSMFHPSVQVLREFRDHFLSKNSLGQRLTELYYSYSPSVADLISRHGELRFAVRMLLLPVTGAAWMALYFGLWILLLPVAALLGVWFLLRKFKVCHGQACLSPDHAVND